MRLLTSHDRFLINYWARHLLGRPYKLKGDSISAYNCSQFIAKVYEFALGIHIIPRTDWLYLTFEVIKRERLIIGDLVFFCSKPRPAKRLATHVAIYLGDDLVIHSRQKVGCVAIEKIDDLLEDYELLESKDHQRCHEWLEEILSS